MALPPVPHRSCPVVFSLMAFGIGVPVAVKKCIALGSLSSDGPVWTTAAPRRFFPAGGCSLLILAFSGSVMRSSAEQAGSLHGFFLPASPADAGQQFFS